MQKPVRLVNFSLIVIGALPTLIALAVCARMLWLIWPDLEQRRRYGALEGLFVMAAPGAMATVIGIWGLIKHRTPPRAAKLGLLALGLLCFYAYFQLPAAQPAMRSWIFDSANYTTVVIAAQLPLFYYLLYLLAAAFSIESRRGLILSGLATVAVPVSLYAGFHLLRFMPQANLFVHFGQIFFLTLNAVFSFLLLRLFLYMGRHHAEKLKHPRNFIFAQFLFVGALPFLGLVLNAHGPLARDSQSALGNFASYAIWLLALANATFYILPRVENRKVSLLLLALRVAGFTFVLYFCVVFLLFLPLALVLIVAFGLGFLLLIPYLAAAFQIVRLRRDLKELTGNFERRTVVGAVVMGTLLLPTLCLAHIYRDRSFLTETLSYVQRPPLALNQNAPVSAEAALAFARVPERNARGFRNAAGHLPIYDSFYRTIVFDGAELSENLRRRIERVFSPQAPDAVRLPARIPASAVMGKIETQSRTKGNLTTSTLRVRFDNTGNGPSEFSGQISLPDGVFLTGHWLTIDGVEVPAQITTKNTAIWVYDRITERQRDPSLIYYEAPNTLRWRVFPVPPHGFREARLEVSHAYEAKLQIAGRKISLPGLTAPVSAFSSTSGRTQLLAPAKGDASFTRNPYLHFVADCSKNGPKDIPLVAELAAKKLGVSLAHARISYVDSSIRTENFAGTATCPKRTGGFFAELAIRSILHEAYVTGGKNFPLVVILSPQKLALAWEDLSFARRFYADADGFVQAIGNEILAFDFSGNRLAEGRLHFPLPVRNAGGRLVGTGATLVPAANGGGATLAALDGIEHHLDFWSGGTAARARAVIAAIESNTLNPAAGSIVLETEAQRRKLADLHTQMLKAANELDAGEPMRMSEPWFYLILIAAVAALKKMQKA